MKAEMRAIQAATLFVAALSVPGGAQLPESGQAPSWPLTDTSVVVREGGLGEIHHYTAELEAGAFVEISASQDTARLGLALTGPDGDTRSVDLPSLDPLPERLLFVTSGRGTHRLDVTLSKVSNSASTGHTYELRVLAWRPATEQDRRRDRCFAATAEADRIARGGRSLADLTKAIDLLKGAAACWQQESDAGLEMTALASLAGLSSFFSEYRLDSAAAFERLIPLLRAAGRDDVELLALDDLLVEYNDDGRFDRSREIAVEMQALAARLGNRRREGLAFQRLGYSEYSLGSYDAARRAALSALDVGTQVADEALMAMAHLLLGRVDDVAGDYEAALARYGQGLRLSSKDRQAAPALRNALGFLHLRRGDREEAARQFEARLAIAATYVQRDTEALARVGLGDVRLSRGDRAGAREMYAAAAEALRRGMPNLRCIALQRLARHALADGLLDEAAAHFAEMLTINQQMGNPPCEAEAQSGIADVAFARGDLDTAEAAARQVIQIAEQFREAAPNLESRALGFGAVAPAFDRAVRIGMARVARGDQGAAARALLFNERALARGLLDHISQTGADDTFPGGALADERRRLRQQWRVRVAQYQAAALSRGDRERAETLRQEMTALDLQLRDLESRGDTADARLRLIRPPVLEIDALQSLLDEDTALVEYALGETQSYVWVVSPRRVRALALPPRAAVEAAARAVHRDLTTPAGAVQPGADERRRQLSRLVLAPVAPWLTARRLVIVSAGALSLVPFAALPLERSAGGSATLLSQFEIVHAPSATTLAAMRALTERRAAPSKRAVVFADPIFEAADPRASSRRTARTATPTASASRSPNALRSADARTLTALGASFPRLPFSRAEANALTALAPGQVTTFLDGLATRDRALGRGLADYRFIHFATHGVVHPEVPNLSSIVLSFMDGAGSRHDPFLTLPDIYEMRVNAELVVLSACSTAEGKHVPGEGPIGLARGFMYAGAPRVVASLWRVNDSATAELMKRFYRGMLAEGLPPAAALRSAQQQVAAMPRWASPYYWAPFVLQGDWR